jgi:hypothetical protein
MGEVLVAAVAEALVAAWRGAWHGRGENETAVGILRSRFSSLAYIPQTNKANDLSHWRQKSGCLNYRPLTQMDPVVIDVVT